MVDHSCSGRIETVAHPNATSMTDSTALVDIVEPLLGESALPMTITFLKPAFILPLVSILVLAGCGGGGGGGAPQPPGPAIQQSGDQQQDQQLGNQQQDQQLGNQQQDQQSGNQQQPVTTFTSFTDTGFGPWMESQFTLDATVSTSNDGSDPSNPATLNVFFGNTNRDSAKPANLANAEFNGNVHGWNYTTNQNQSGTVTITFRDNGANDQFSYMFTGVPLRNSDVGSVETNVAANGLVTSSQQIGTPEERNIVTQTMRGYFYSSGNIVGLDVQQADFSDNLLFKGLIEASR